MESSISAPAGVGSAQRPRWLVRLAVVVGAVIAAVLVWFVAGPLADVTLEATLGDDAPITTITLASVIISSLLASLVGWGLLALLERVATQVATRVWLVITVLFLLVSLLGPTAANSGGAVVALLLMHIAVAAVLIPGLLMTRREA